MMWRWDQFMEMGPLAWIGMALIGLFWLAVVVGVIVLVVYLVRRAGQGQQYPPYGGRPPEARSSALQILEERYARGDIDREEFLQRKADLGS